MDVQLFNKRELFLTGLDLAGVNLDAVAAVVAGELGLPENEVLVVDARDDLLTLDILNSQVEIERVAGKGSSLLSALSKIPGLEVGPQTRIHSEGVLGMINLGAEEYDRLPEKLAAMEKDIKANVSRRALVLPTGNEIIAGKIKDTNTPFLLGLLKSAGFKASAGTAVPDDLDAAIGILSQAAFSGYGLVVSTGGTGAEKKDCMVEAIEALDPEAATPYVVHYKRGQGRHHKDGVRLAVGRMELTTYVALTGPHREVNLVAPTLIQGLKRDWSNPRLAEEMANLLRAELAAQPCHHESLKHNRVHH